MNKLKYLLLKLWILRIFILHRNSLPTHSNIENPKMEYDIFSGAFIWEDEGLWEAHYQLADAFKSVIHQRMKLIVGLDNNIGVFRSVTFDEQIFNMAKRFFPHWIGFQSARCSYNSELAHRIIRIKKVEQWKYEKLLNKKFKDSY